MSGSGDTTLPFYRPDPKLFSISVKTKLVGNLSTKKVGTKIYFLLSTAFMGIKPLHLAAMLHCACCLQYIKKLSVAHTGDFNHTNYTLK